MPDIAISVERISKRYALGAGPSSGTFRELISSAFQVQSRTPDASTEKPEGSREFWALDDVSFSINRGEVIGLIGGNGAGKSTLLKIISRITAPTSGRIILHGRVASLLEVGTGFHPELTGRENIFLNGAILGLRQPEIKKRFDEIAAFAEIDNFLDVPVKRYSSGMYVRLAFAVAANMDPDVLIVDEVLAVGDAEFQKKCLAKLDDVSSRSSRTVLFVSHNMQAVRRLCSRCIWLSKGTVRAIGASQNIIDQYIELPHSNLGEIVWNLADRPGSSEFSLLALRILDNNGRVAARHSSSSDIFIEMDILTSIASRSLDIGFDVTTSDGAIVLRTYSSDGPDDDWPPIKPGKITTLRCHIPAAMLNAGRYHVLPRVSIHKIRWLINDPTAHIGFDVMLDHGSSSHWVGISRPGVISPVLQWQSSTQ